MLQKPTLHIAADHGGFTLKEQIKQHYAGEITFIDHGAKTNDPQDDYPDVLPAFITALQQNETAIGIVICGSGIGISIAVNRHVGLRAALCHSATVTKLARQHNNANVLALGGRIVSAEVAFTCIEAFLNTEFEGERHQRRLDKLEALCACK